RKAASPRRLEVGRGGRALGAVGRALLGWRVMIDLLSVVVARGIAGPDSIRRDRERSVKSRRSGRKQAVKNSGRTGAGRAHGRIRIAAAGGPRPGAPRR